MLAVSGNGREGSLRARSGEALLDVAGGAGPGGRYLPLDADFATSSWLRACRDPASRRGGHADDSALLPDLAAAGRSAGLRFDALGRAHA
jgi:hypothetical protein